MDNIDMKSIVILNHRALYKIARDIRNDWANVNYAAKPYLDAMEQLTSINDTFFMDDAKSVVLYFLANASGWRGAKAREIKAELKQIINQ